MKNVYFSQYNTIDIMEKMLENIDTSLDNACKDFRQDELKTLNFLSETNKTLTKCGSFFLCGLLYILQ